jgi:hypothetical protein
MRTAAHSCLMRRKSLGGARTTAATTELNESDDACDASVAPSPARDDADDELRHSRAHLRPLLPAAFSVAFRPTSDLIHFPDCPIAAATTRDATACLFLCSAEASFRLGSEEKNARSRGSERRQNGSSGGVNRCPFRPRQGQGREAVRRSWRIQFKIRTAASRNRHRWRPGRETRGTPTDLRTMYAGTHMPSASAGGTGSRARRLCVRWASRKVESYEDGPEVPVAAV